MGQLGGEDIAQAPHVNGQLGKSKTTPRRLARVWARVGTIRPSLGPAVMLHNATRTKFEISSFQFTFPNLKKIPTENNHSFNL